MVAPQVTLFCGGGGGGTRVKIVDGKQWQSAKRHNHPSLVFSFFFLAAAGCRRLLSQKKKSHVNGRSDVRVRQRVHSSKLQSL
jgi:hypothetical protein